MVAQSIHHQPSTINQCHTATAARIAQIRRFECSTKIRACDQEEFHALDRRIMGVVFAVHNEFGRLLDEDLYKREIAARCVAMGIQPVEREVWIRVSG